MMFDYIVLVAEIYGYSYSCCINYVLFVLSAEKELVEFLAEEIVAEKKAQKLKTIPTTLEGFTVSLNGAEVNLEKKDDTDT